MLHYRNNRPGNSFQLEAFPRRGFRRLFDGLVTTFTACVMEHLIDDAEKRQFIEKPGVPLEWPGFLAFSFANLENN